MTLIYKPDLRRVKLNHYLRGYLVENWKVIMQTDRQTDICTPNRLIVLKGHKVAGDYTFLSFTWTQHQPGLQLLHCWGPVHFSQLYLTNNITIIKILSFQLSFIMPYSKVEWKNGLDWPLYVKKCHYTLALNVAKYSLIVAVRYHASTVHAVVMCLSVHMSQVRVLPKWLNTELSK